MNYEINECVDIACERLPKAHVGAEWVFHYKRKFAVGDIYREGRKGYRVVDKSWCFYRIVPYYWHQHR